MKGKGEMTTYWLEAKGGRAPPPKDEIWPDFSKSALIEIKEEEAPAEEYHPTIKALDEVWSRIAATITCLTFGCVMKRIKTIN